MRLEGKELQSLGERLARMWAQGVIARTLTTDAEQPAEPAQEDQPVTPDAGTEA